MPVGRHPSRRHASPEDAPIGLRIRRRRRDLELTQADLAAPDYTKSFISQLEGGFADPSLDTLRFLSRRLRTSLSTIAGDDADQRLAGLEGLLRWAREAARDGDDALARRLVGVATETAARGGWDEHRAEAALLLAEIEMRAGAFERADALIEEAGALAPAVGQRMVIRTELARGLLALRRNDPRAAAAAFQRALVLSRKNTRHPDLTVRALFGIAASAVQAGDLRQARRRLQTAVRLTARQRLESLNAQARLGLGMTLDLDGAPLDAVGHLQTAADAFARQGDGRRRLESLLALAGAALAAGNSALALRALDEGAQLPEATAVAGASARIAALRGRALLVQGREGEAATLLSDAIGQLTGTARQAELAAAAKALGEYHQAREDHEGAARYLAIAAEAASAAASRDDDFADLVRD
jgi:tetratricopeptide (TPR) repeat protein